VPPLAEIAKEYALPVWVPGNEEVVMERAGIGATTLTVALDFFVVSAALVAVTVTLVLVVTPGAENRPPVETVPAVAVQDTAVLPVPCTLALNCCVLPDITLALLGETLTLMVGLDECPIVICPCSLATVPAASVAVTQK